MKKKPKKKKPYIAPFNGFGELSVFMMMKNIINGHTKFPKHIADPIRRVK